ncbi:unnamed protein product [marine sediment metagenome]|uniref:Uncharacterized protein n=1 Tax=marine sediment metagenome TaxID=412755 RepID=X1CW15_9ZZZZ
MQNKSSLRILYKNTKKYILSNDNFILVILRNYCKITKDEEYNVANIVGYI